ncbi:hypothetical protein MIND_00494100 [Mycena indigotica]|uniref:Uncharacterized protein n=1 Tax=Mycena indigotica TaxID=2126181 RepID=A0A8H6SX35_9AGAR|nr:uncharacterized protein MIND_00494100 [Mycena indigotica]KAF7307011.1 hypothetical protein MIND_00494100 [Mycena indigotica]
MTTPSDAPPILDAPSSQTRPPLPLSASFPVLPTTSSISPSRPLKRRLASTSALNFFVPAADTFKPLPYAPNAGASRTSLAERVRPATQHPASTVSMDPSPADPDAIFLRYPFASFPDQELYPDGITYTTLVEKPNWFLVAEDYISEKGTNPDAVAYPLYLEPPRGWCPAKKKDLKEKGPEVWPDGEQPRLRCTFCRRTYAGVNAKSMWRRHVFEKHKIAMSNRRNDLERPRGRSSSNKENKRANITKALKKEESHETIVNLDDDDVETLDAPVDPLAASPDVDFPASPAPERVIPPASPYDPLLTPSFRHSPPRLPSDHPWRYNSPSHPLHRSRNVSLTMLRGDSPIIQTPLLKKSMDGLSSPCGSSTLAFRTPESVLKILPFPRSLFARSKLGSTPPSSVTRHTRASSDVSEAWDAEGSLSLDPFITTWDDDDNKSPPTSSPARAPKSPTPVVKGAGVNLLAPFTLPDTPGNMLEIDDLLQLEVDDEEEVFVSLTCSQTSNGEDPPSKRRRTGDIGI